MAKPQNPSIHPVSAFAPPIRVRAARLAGGAALLGAALAGCGGDGDSSTGSSAPTNGAPSLSLSVQPSSLVLGQSAQLTWTASSGTQCTASGGWSGAQASSGTQTITPGSAGTATFTLACSGEGYSGSATQTVSLAVNAPGPQVTLTAPSGTVAGNVTLSADVSGAIAINQVEFFLNDSTSLGIATSAPYTVTWDTTQAADGSATVVAVATDAEGHVGRSTAATVTVANNAPAPATLSELQAQVFTPMCSGCHSGNGSSLPGVQNLTAGNSYAALVGVASIEQPSLMRVAPGDANNSYLIRKLEGAAGITGSRMPLGGPPLDTATLDRVKSWIAAGAPNN